MTEENLDEKVASSKDDDACFCAAMRIAIAAGLESVVEGVFVDLSQRPPGARVYRPMALGSFSGSSAGWCADWAVHNRGGRWRE